VISGTAKTAKLAQAAIKAARDGGVGRFIGFFPYRADPQAHGLPLASVSGYHHVKPHGLAGLHGMEKADKPSDTAITSRFDGRLRSFAVFAVPEINPWPPQ